MKWYGILALLLAASAIADDDSGSSEEVNELPLAENCNTETCVLPNCRCSSTNIPGGFAARDVPQFVTVTFDDGINVNNILTYRETLFNRFNSNGCRAGATFYVSHEYTNYVLVNELYNQGYEIALHSISHQTPQTYWANADYNDMMREFGDQKVQMSHFANIPYDSIKGVRIPFLQMTGNASFQVMAEHGLEYDCSWPTIQYTNPGLWPYSLDYASTQDCIVPPCPTASIPKAWVKPMITWSDLNGVPCSMVDACFFIMMLGVLQGNILGPKLTGSLSFPDRNDEDEWFQFILTNFERHYMGNRAPFGFFVHEAFLSAYPAVRRAYVRFLDLINNLEDVFMVNSIEVLEWVKDPISINEYRERSCRTFIPTHCSSASCGPLNSSHNGLDYWMQICNVCPRVYPWLGNPLGL